MKMIDLQIYFYKKMDNFSCKFQNFFGQLAMNSNLKIDDLIVLKMLKNLPETLEKYFDLVYTTDKNWKFYRAKSGNKTSKEAIKMAGLLFQNCLSSGSWGSGSIHILIDNKGKPSACLSINLDTSLITSEYGKKNSLVSLKTHEELMKFYRDENYKYKEESQIGIVFSSIEESLLIQPEE